MIYDCFTFFNETKLLKARLQYLHNAVDFFVISECNYTHSGKPKAFLFDIADYEQYRDKIIYLKFCLDKPDENAWVTEHNQRSYLINGLKDVNPDDIIIVSDIDEIPNRELLKSFDSNDPKAFSQRFSYYYINCLSESADSWWNGSVIFKVSSLDSWSIEQMRGRRNVWDRIPNGGWHFSYLGGIEAIRTKIESFAHTELDVPGFKSDGHLQYCLDGGHDLFNRSGVTYRVERDLSIFPLTLLKAFEDNFSNAILA